MVYQWEQHETGFGLLWKFFAITKIAFLWFAKSEEEKNM